MLTQLMLNIAIAVNVVLVIANLRLLLKLRALRVKGETVIAGLKAAEALVAEWRPPGVPPGAKELVFELAAQGFIPTSREVDEALRFGHAAAQQYLDGLAVDHRTHGNG